MPPPAGGPPPAEFSNEPDTDPALPANREWLAAAVAQAEPTLRTAALADVAAADEAVARAAAAQRVWGALPGARRREVLHGVADRLAAARGELVGVMAHEAGKTPDQSDPEVSELVDFARWYADAAPELDDVPDARLTPLGVVLVTPPWNFPVAIPGGGCLAALAAGDAVLLKPAPQTPRCAEVVVARDPRRAGRRRPARPGGRGPRAPRPRRRGRRRATARDPPGRLRRRPDRRVRDRADLSVLAARPAPAGRDEREERAGRDGVGRRRPRRRGPGEQRLRARRAEVLGRVAGDPGGRTSGAPATSTASSWT